MMLLKIQTSKKHPDFTLINPRSYSQKPSATRVKLKVFYPLWTDEMVENNVSKPNNTKIFSGKTMFTKPTIFR